MERQFLTFFDVGAQAAASPGFTASLVHVANIPATYRRKCWTELAHVVYRKHAYPAGHYTRIATEPIPLRVREDIDKDVRRAFPEFARRDPTYTNRLDRVLTAHAATHPEYGYTQGQNFFAGVLVHWLEEEEAYWAFCHFTETLVPGYFTPEMKGAMVDAKLAEVYVREYYPSVYGHLKRLGIRIQQHVLEWFVAVYCKTLNIDTVLFPALDELFLHGPPGLFLIALGIIGVLEKSILDATDEIDARTVLMQGPGQISVFSAISEATPIQAKVQLTLPVVVLQRGAFRERLEARVKTKGSIFV